MDKRKEANLRVKKALTDSLFQMMENRPLSEITITEIIRDSGVARVSFYRNYNSKEDILITLVRDVLEDFRETADYDLSDVYSSHHLKRVIEYFIKNRSYVLNLYHSGYGTMLLSEIEKCFPDKRYELFTSTRSLDNIRLYQKLGYMIFARKSVNDELEFVYMEK